MRQAHIFYKDQLAGILTETDAGYEFRYLPEYEVRHVHPAQAVLVRSVLLRGSRQYLQHRPDHNGLHLNRGIVRRRHLSSSQTRNRY